MAPAARAPVRWVAMELVDLVGKIGVASLEASDRRIEFAAVGVELYEPSVDLRNELFEPAPALIAIEEFHRVRIPNRSRRVNGPIGPGRVCRADDLLGRLSR